MMKSVVFLALVLIIAVSAHDPRLGNDSSPRYEVTIEDTIKTYIKFIQLQNEGIRSGSFARQFDSLANKLSNEYRRNGFNSTCVLACSEVDSIGTKVMEEMAKGNKVIFENKYEIVQ